VKVIILACCYYLILGRKILETIQENASEKRTIYEKNEKSRKMETWKE